MSFFSNAFNYRTDLLKQKNRIRRFSTGLVTACGLLLSGAAYAQATDMDLTSIAFSPANAPANSTFTATFNIANASLTDAADDAQLVADFPVSGIPAGGSATLVSVTPSSGTCATSGTQFTCSFGTLNPSETRTVTAVYQLNAATGTWMVEGTVSTSTPDGNLANDTDDATATTTFGVDLGISGGPTQPTSPVASGTPFEYPLQITNNGPFDLTAGQQIIVEFTVPDRVHMSGWRSSTWDEWICSPRTADTGTQVTCVFDKGLANGQTKELNILAVGMRATGSAVDTVFGVSAQQNDGTPIPDIVTSNDTQTIGVEFTASTDVSIAKTAVIDSGPGQVVFTLTPQLRGGDLLDGVPVTVTDTFLPDELTWVSTTPGDGWTCDPPAPATSPYMAITCTRPEYTGDNYTNMPPIVIRMTPLGGVPNATNIGSVSLTGRGDPVPSNNTSVVTVDDGHADIHARKGTSFSPAVVGQPFTYQMLAHNSGPWGVPTGQTISLNDTLPDGMTLNEAPTLNDWTCTITNTGGPVSYPVTSTTANPVVIHCERTDGLAAGRDSAAVVLTVQTATPGNYHNEVCASLGNGIANDQNSANDCSSFYPGDGQVTTTQERADLQIVKGLPIPDPVNAGELLTYTLDITNAGPNSATSITVTDVLSPLVNIGGLESVEITAQSNGATYPGSCTVDNRASPVFPINGTLHIVRCNFPQMDPGDTASIEIVVRPNINLTGNHTNTATVFSSAVGDPDRSNNTASATSQIIGIFDLTVSTWASTATASNVDSAPAGSLVSFTSRVTSLGPSSAPNGKVTIQVPPNGIYQGLSSTGGANCDDSLAGAPTYEITCTWPGEIPAGAIRDITYTVLIPNDTSQTVTSSSHVELNTAVAPGETSTTNNDASKTITLAPASTDIQMRVNDLPDPVTLGSTTVYTVEVSNAGPSSATNPTLNITFAPDSATFSYQGGLTVTPVSGSCTPPATGATSGTFTCTWPVLLPNETGTVTFNMQAESVLAGAQTGSNRVNVSVSADETDPSPGNNTDSANTTASRIPPVGVVTDLSVVKTATVTEIFQGRPFDYTLTVTNNGPGTYDGAMNAEITDDLPTGLTYISDTGGCTYTAPTLTCPVSATLTSGQQYAVTVTVQVEPTYGEKPIENIARVVFPPDSNPGNNTSGVIVNAHLITHQVPTLPQWALLLLALMIGAAALTRQGNHRRP